MQFLLLLLIVFQDVAPFKPKSEFEIKIDLSFKEKRKQGDGSQSNFTIDYTETVEQRNKKLSGNQLPYLELKIKFNLLSADEEKVKIVNNLGKIVYSKKADVNTVIRLDLGYIDDVKDELTPNDYNVILLNSEKKEIDRINIKITKDGTFLVNNEKRGKF
jgi:hypothetical protein